MGRSKGARRDGGRRHLRWALAALALAVGAYAAVTAVRLVFAYNEMVEAKGLLLTVEATLQRDGLDTSPADLAGAESQSMSAWGKFRSARDFLTGDPLLRIAGWTPWLGAQVSAARELAGIGYEGSEIGLAGVAALQAYNGVKADDEGALGEHVMAYLEATAPMMAEVDERLSAIGEKRDRIDTGWILPPLSDYVEQLDERLDRVERSVAKYRHGRAVAEHTLGFEGPRRLLVLGMDNTELLPGGGLIGMYGVITFDEGRVLERSFGEVSELIEAWQARSGGEYVEPPGPLKRYLLRDWTWNLAVSDWSPDFPTAARQALLFYERSGAEPLEDVIAIDFAGLQGLLAVLGPTEVEGYGVVVDSENVTEEILARIGRPRGAGEGDHAFAAAVATEVVAGALAVDQGRWSALLETMDRLAEEKHLFLHAGDGETQRSIVELGWAGQVRDAPGDYLMAVNASVHSTKLNLVLEERMDVAVQLNGDGSAQNTVALHYENPLSEWARTHEPELVSQMLTGFYGGYVRLLVPPEGRLADVRLNGESAGAEEITQEAGKASFGRYLPLPRDSAADLVFAYSVPAAVNASRGRHEYRLLIQKQAGVRATPVGLAVSLPPGAKVESVSLDGQQVRGGSLEIETVLSVDRELVVRYEP